jgi:hypothetical protein
MIEMTDVTGRDEADILPTPTLDAQLAALGFTPLGALCATPQGPDSEQVVAVWVSPERDAFAVPEANPRGEEVLCYFRTLLHDGALIDTSDEANRMHGFFVGRTRLPIRGAGYDVVHMPGQPLAELWTSHQRRVAAEESAPRPHRTMEQCVALSRHSVALFSRVLRVGMFTDLAAVSLLLLCLLALGGDGGAPLATKVLIAGGGIALYIPGVQISMRLARRLPAKLWPKAPAAI